MGEPIPALVLALGLLALLASAWALTAVFLDAPAPAPAPPAAPPAEWVRGLYDDLR